MDQIGAAFPLLQAPASGEAEERLGPSHTEVVFVVATKQEMRTSQQRNSLEAYGESAHEWRPFSLDSARSILDFVTDAIAEENKGSATDTMTFHELSVEGEAEDTIKHIEAAEARRNLVVVVDPWSLEIDRYFKFMRAFDAVNSAAVLIAWDSRDQETQVKREELERLLREEAIPNRVARRSIAAIVEEVDSVEDLQRTLGITLISVRSTILKDAVPRNTASEQKMPRIVGLIPGAVGPIREAV
jgi:FxsC-like protein